MTLEALKMGDYGAYVWSSYALALLALIAMAAIARNACNRELKAAQRRTQANRNGQPAPASSTSAGAGA